MILALVSGVLLTLSFPPVGLPALGFVALAPLGLAARRASTGRSAAARGAAALGLHSALVLAWLPLSVGRVLPEAVLLWAVLVALLAALGATVGWTVRGAGTELGVPVALSLPLAWTGAEWVRGVAAGPLAFPWLPLGTGLAARPEWASLAEVTGVHGVSFWMTAVAGLVATAAGLVTGRGRGARTRVAGGAVLAAALLLAAGGAAWGVERARAIDSLAGPPSPATARVGVVQHGVGPRASPPERAGATADVLAGLVEPGGGLEPLREGPPPDLVLLPEATVPVPPGHPAAPRVLRSLRAVAVRAGAPVLFGGVGSLRSPAGDTVFTNAAYVMTAAGVAPMRFDKRRLVPGFETPLVPLPAGLARGGYRAGSGAPLLRVGGVEYGPLICWEAAFPAVTRALGANGADVLVNLTNDGWFGRPGRWPGPTWGYDQHAAHLVLRAIETRRPAVRAASTGISLALDAAGRPVGSLALFGPAAGAWDVRSPGITTVFVRWGDVAGPLSAVLWLLLAWGTERRRWLRERTGVVVARIRHTGPAAV